MREFIKHRLDNKLNLLTERKTKDHAGKRKGAGRSHGTIKAATKRVSLPIDIATWITQPEALERIRKWMHKSQ